MEMHIEYRGIKPKIILIKRIQHYASLSFALGEVLLQGPMHLYNLKSIKALVDSSYHERIKVRYVDGRDFAFVGRKLLFHRNLLKHQVLLRVLIA